ncbi:transporter substrate-binding domain-containing protein [Pseudoalteromonas sp. MMG006]|uniref:substrate-binding periplasmic protein n=1 Tax=unclassified Pseudoalteromonas TaxID=194690 RepID=UPI001B397E7C|nr:MULTISPECIES: transporter substrate-binding domain-containing protein [unclassified Pseudoalteromonas]MBQ4799121.1 transporter substrate-binding domain-containing protein [Pseudoalteromonas sp. MMG006]MBQ4857682.1 transporter substrate-binding domain-containing protein [Pseudoalteromonas sp. MMG007]
MKLFLLVLCFICIRVNAAEISIVTEVFPDFQYIDSNGQLAGRSVDKVRKALASTDIQYSMSANSWAVSYNAVLRDENTCIFSIVKLPNRADKFSWVAELENFDSAIYALKSRNIRLNTLNDAKKYKTAVLRDNFSHHYLLDRGFSETKNLLIIDSLDKIDKLISTRHNILDFVILSNKQFNFRAKREPKLKLLEPVLTLNTKQSSLYFACNKNMEQSLQDKLSAAFNATKNSY